MEQRGADRPGSRQAGGYIGDGSRRYLLWHAIGYLVLGRHETGHCLRDDVVSGAHAVRTFPPVGGILAIYEARVYRGQRFVVYAEVVRHVGTVVDDDDIGVRNQAIDDIAPFLPGEVQGQAALASVEAHERLALAGFNGEGMPPRVAPGRFNLDDVGAHVGKQHAAERSGDDFSELDNFDAIQSA